jgi:predicted small metal-binding protein
MKQFACGDVVPGCDATFQGIDDDAVLAEVAHHARDRHGLAEVPGDLVEAVVGAIRVA